MSEPGGWTEAQRETVEGISPMGLMMHDGQPCECGPEPYSTKSVPLFSDGMLYRHRCSECGNGFETWTEG